MTDKKLTRHEMREAAFIILFQMQISGSSLEDVLQDSEESFGLIFSKDSLNLVNGVLEHNDELSSIIASYSPTRAYDRIPMLNRTIIKIALYEMKYCPNVPDKVAINEAIELSKEYGRKPDSAFVNGVLNSYFKDSANA